MTTQPVSREPERSPELGVDELYAARAVRSDLTAAHKRLWAFLRAPGTWLSADEKVAIIAETRAAQRCALCAERKAALSPTWASGEHDRASSLPEEWVDIVHWIVTDVGRMTKELIERLREAGVDDAMYVEILGTCAFAMSIDMFHRAAGLERLPLPTPLPGEPSRDRPSRVDDIGGWVPVLSKRSEEGKALWAGLPRVSNVARGLSLVPAQARVHLELLQTQYVPLSAVASMDDIGRALRRDQIELVAGRTSAVNECFY